MMTTGYLQQCRLVARRFSSTTDDNNDNAKHNSSNEKPQQQRGVLAKSRQTNRHQGRRTGRHLSRDTNTDQRRLLVTTITSFCIIVIVTLAHLPGLTVNAQQHHTGGERGSNVEGAGEESLGGGAEDPGHIPPRVDPVDMGTTKHASRTDDNVVHREEESIRLDGLSVAEMRELREASEKVEFQTQVDKMMTLIINSLYKNKEIFLRELISNASDALDKIRFQSLTDHTALDATPELSIKIKAEPGNRMLHITDTGVGMTYMDLVLNLGTLAKSGTNEFISRIDDESTTPNQASDLIGQFGVGFYSAFLVADHVFVTTKHNDDIQYIWESDSKSFSISPDPRGNTLLRGTTISLHLREEAKEYCYEYKIRELVNKYSQFITFDIFFWDEKQVRALKEEEPEEVVEEVEDEDDEDSVVKTEKQENKKKYKPKKKREIVTKWVQFWDLINDNKPIWTRSSSDLKPENYTAFYHSITKDTNDPLAHIHFSAEGEVGFKSILFIPSQAPNDTMSQGHKNGLKLYVRRVFITENLEELMPQYFNFLRGVVDSDDLPLNVSREMLQQHKLLLLLRKKLIRKAIEMFSKLDEESYKIFWSQYKGSIELGIYHDSIHRVRLSKLLRFPSTYTIPDQELDNVVDNIPGQVANVTMTSLSEYVDRMKPGQEQIYYMAGKTIRDIRNSPFMEKVTSYGYEVLYLIDPIDEHTMMTLGQYEGKSLQSVAKEGLKLIPPKGKYKDLEKLQQRQASKEVEFHPFFTWLKDDLLKNKVANVIVSDRLMTSPMALVPPPYGWSGSMERIQAASVREKMDEETNRIYQAMLKTLEVNVRHPLVKRLKVVVDKVVNVKDNDDNLTEDEVPRVDDQTRELALVMFETARLRSDYALDDMAGYVQRLLAITKKGLNVSEQANTEDEDDNDDDDALLSFEAEAEELLAKLAAEDNADYFQSEDYNIEIE